MGEINSAQVRLEIHSRCTHPSRFDEEDKKIIPLKEWVQVREMIPKGYLRELAVSKSMGISCQFSFIYRNEIGSSVGPFSFKIKKINWDI